MQRLRDEVFASTQISLNPRTLIRFINRTHRPRKDTVATLQRFMANQLAQRHEASQ